MRQRLRNEVQVRLWTKRADHVATTRTETCGVDDTVSSFFNGGSLLQGLDLASDYADAKTEELLVEPRQVGCGGDGEDLDMQTDSDQVHT